MQRDRKAKLNNIHTHKHTNRKLGKMGRTRKRMMPQIDTRKRYSTKTTKNYTEFFNKLCFFFNFSDYFSLYVSTIISLSCLFLRHRRPKSGSEMIL